MNRKSITHRVIPFPASARRKPLFDGASVSFNLTDKEWADNNLVYIRLAVQVMNFDSDKLERRIRQLLPIGDGAAVTELLDGWCSVRNHLTGLVEGIDIAVARTELVLKKIGPVERQP
jgi:hypothetical protein